MESFFADADASDRSALERQREKLRDPTRRCAVRVRSAFGGDYIRSGLRRAAEIQEGFYV